MVHCHRAPVSFRRVLFCYLIISGLAYQHRYDAVGPRVGGIRPDQSFQRVNLIYGLTVRQFSTHQRSFQKKNSSDIRLKGLVRTCTRDRRQPLTGRWLAMVTV